MASNDSIKKTISVALILCIVCSVIVSVAAVILKPAQLANMERDFKENILAAAGVLDAGKSVDELFEQFETRIVDLQTGKFTDAVDPETYDQVGAAGDSALSRNLTAEEDLAGISRQENYAEVYILRKPNGELERIVLPIRGYGLWSTLFGFIALDEDLNTVAGLTYYDHGETPGLGGEVDNPKWKAKWEGKKVYNQQGEVALSVVKGTVDEGTPNAEYKVDGLSGATLTSNGVDNMIEFWLGEQGYGPFLDNLKRGEA